jgi:hypothetical protein
VQHMSLDCMLLFHSPCIPLSPSDTKSYASHPRRGAHEVRRIPGYLVPGQNECTIISKDDQRMEPSVDGEMYASSDSHSFHRVFARSTAGVAELAYAVQKQRSGHADSVAGSHR